MSLKRIAKELTTDQILTPHGKNIWSASTIRSILTNEKYKGDALLQKSFTTDFLTKTMKVNEGEVPQYYVTGNHEPIIEPATWETVQAELARRSGKGTASTHPFATRIKCADCGGWYGRKVWHSTSKYRRHIWRCNNKYKPGYHCTTPHVTEQQIKEAFTQALTEQVKDNATLDHVIQLLNDTVYNTTELETRQTKIAKKMEETVALINQLITENATTAHDPRRIRPALPPTRTTLPTARKRTPNNHKQDRRPHHPPNTSQSNPPLPSNPATTRIQRSSVERPCEPCRSAQ